MISKKVSSFIFLIFSASYSFGQNVNIYVCPLANPALTKSMVCVSKADGSNLFEYVMTEEDIENGSEYHLNLDDPGQYCFTIINQYEIDTINEGKPFFFNKTYYNMNGDLHIYNYDHPQIPKWYPEKSVLLSLHNMPTIEHWQYHSDATIATFKQNGTDVWAQTNIRPGEDLFVVMKAVNDSKYRYLYIPAEEIPFFDDHMKSSDAIQRDWRFLKTDLNHITVNLPFESEFIGTISAVNNSTGNNCMFFDKDVPEKSIHYPENYEKYNPKPPQLPSEKRKLDIFIPSQNLSGFNARTIWWQENMEYEYRIHHGFEITFPYYGENYFRPDSLVNDTIGVRIKMKSFPENFRIFFRRKTSDEFPKIGYRMNQIFRSTWIVVGKNSGEINFRLPLISENALAHFENFSSWYYEYFENVKFLEKDPHIDWINFFHDYNVLLVHTPRL